MLDGSIIFRLQGQIEDIFAVESWHLPPQAEKTPGKIIYRGRLLWADSELAYQTLAERWLPLEYTPLLQFGPGDQLDLVAQPGLVYPKPSNPWINLVLFIITLLSVLLVGSFNEGINPFENPLGLIAGLPFALSFLTILTAHEFGHYFAARYHGVAVTLPYFIPFPTIWGTMGAFIQLRSPTETKKQLFDVGVAGPLAGLVFAVPVLVAGLMMSGLQALPVGEPYLLEGNSIFYWGLKWLIFGQPLPSADGLDVFLHPLAWAGWSGLLVTAFNLIPIGQLDGGHVAYVLFGRRTRWLGYVLLVVLVVMGFVYWQGWFLWALLIGLMVGVGHPPPLNEVTPLGRPRQIVGYLMLLIFVLLFVPMPLVIVGV
jgi:membrane-associated protease RseP (regulator of RpoE activity)